MNFSFWLFWLFLGASKLFIMTVMVLFIHLSICDFVFQPEGRVFWEEEPQFKKKKVPL